jgi:hypothetical protein
MMKKQKRYVMQLIEDTPQQLVYYQNLKTRRAKFTIQEGCNDYTYLLGLAAVPAIVTLALAPRLPTIFIVIVLGLAGAWSLFNVWGYYDDWQRQIKEKWLMVDRQAQQLICRSAFNDGSIIEYSYAAEQIQALTPRDYTNSYWILLEYDSQQDCASLLLEWWETQAERDAVLTQLQAALNLPLETLPEIESVFD